LVPADGSTFGGYLFVPCLGQTPPATDQNQLPNTSTNKKRGYSMRIEAIPVGKNPPDDINVIIEVPVGGEPIKYEMDKASGTLFVDRFLYTPMRYPGNYGFVPHTLSADGDPIDVLVCNTRAIVPGAVINCRPIGVLVMEDDGGGDEKIIAVPSDTLTKRYSKVKNYSDLPSISTEQIEHFFAHYKDLEPNKWVKIHHWGDAVEAARLIRESVARFAAKT
jgi:inorganic pyrophosphatase